MSTELTRTSVPIPRRRGSPNTMAFPRALREAIPDLPTYVGRVLQIDSMNGRAVRTRLFGPRVLLNCVVKETGKLSGEFVVRIDLQPDAARALAATLTQLADQAAPTA